MHAMPSPTTVLYDGSCPICCREISHYKTMDSVGAICWVDVSAPTFVGPPGQSRDVLMQRFHVIKSSGELVCGAAAFVHLWEQLPRWRGLAKLAQIPFVLNVLEFGYTKFLVVRPKLQRIFN